MVRRVPLHAFALAMISIKGAGAEDARLPQLKNGACVMRNARWLVTGIAVVVTLAVGVGVGLFAGGAFKGFSPTLEAEVDDRSSQIVEAVTTEKQVVLLSLAIQGIDVVEQETAQFFGVTIPGTDRSSFMQYSFTAKLGLEGEPVTIAETGENAYLVTVPEFVFIGHDDAVFETAVEKNGVLSWATPEIDTTDMVNRILSSDAEAEYVSMHTDTLRAQAGSFYSQIILSIDPSATVEFEYL